MKKIIFEFKLKFDERVRGKTFFKRLFNLINNRVYHQRWCGGNCIKIFKINLIDIFLPSFIYAFENYKTFTFNDKPITHDKITENGKEDILIDDISHTITHEYIHAVLNNVGFKLTHKQHHYGTEKLGF